MQLYLIPVYDTASKLGSTVNQPEEVSGCLCLHWRRIDVRRYAITWLMIAFCVCISESLQASEVRGKLTGYVYDATSGLGLRDVNLVLSDGQGTSSASDGWFSLPALKPGTDTLRFSHIGYKSKEIIVSITAGQNKFLEITLQPDVIPLQPVTKTGEASEFERATGRFELSPRTLKSYPAIGEADVLRAVQTIPGVTRGHELSTGFYVRGGRNDQNLILLDDITIYTPYHLFGFFSIFDVDALEHAVLYKGGFGAEYGGRLSSVLELRTRSGNSRSLNLHGQLSLLSSKVLAEGPLGERGSWLVSYRRSYIDLLVNLVAPDVFPYSFNDFVATVTYPVSRNARLKLTSFWQKDSYKPRRRSETGAGPEERINEDVVWQNRALGLTYEWLISPTMFSRTTIYGSYYNAMYRVDDQRFFFGALVPRLEFDLDNHIRDLSVKQTLTWTGLSGHTLTTGLHYHNLDYGLNLTTNVVDYDPSISAPDLHELGLFAEDAWQLNPSWQLTAGLRFNYFSNLQTAALVPRLALTTQLSRTHTLKLSAGRYHQNVITANTADDVLAPYEVWVPLQKQHRLASAWHTTAAWVAELSDLYTLRAEAYWKDLANIGILNRGRFLDSDPILHQYDGQAWGLEILAEKKGGRLSGWLGYHFNRTYLDIDGQKVAPSFYRKHSVTLTGEYNFNKKWSVGFSWMLASGQPYQLVVGEYEVPGSTGGVIETDPNFYTYPPYHRLDVSFFRHFHKKNWHLTLYLQIQNLYFQRNYVYPDRQVFLNGLEHTDKFALPILPTLGLRFNL